MANLVKPHQVIRSFGEKMRTDFVPSQTDWKIIKYLMLEPRIRIRDLARKISMSEKTVIRRFNVMSKNHVFDFTVQYNPVTLVNYLYSRMVVLVKSSLRDSVMRQILAKFKEHLMCPVPPNSEHMISFILYAKNIPEIDLVKRKIRLIKGVINADSHMPIRVTFNQNYLVDEIDKRVNDMTLALAKSD